MNPSTQTSAVPESRTLPSPDRLRTRYGRALYHVWLTGCRLWGHGFPEPNELCPGQFITKDPGGPLRVARLDERHRFVAIDWPDPDGDLLDWARPSESLKNPLANPVLDRVNDLLVACRERIEYIASDPDNPATGVLFEGESACCGTTLVVGNVSLCHWMSIERAGRTHYALTAFGQLLLLWGVLEDLTAAYGHRNDVRALVGSTFPRGLNWDSVLRELVEAIEQPREMVLNSATEIVSLGGRTESLLPDQLSILRKIFEANGASVKGTVLAQVADVDRADRVIARLPEWAQRRIIRKRGAGGGYRVIPPVRIDD